MKKRSLMSSDGALLRRSPSRARLDQAVRLKADKKPPARGANRTLVAWKRHDKIATNVRNGRKPPLAESACGTGKDWRPASACGPTSDLTHQPQWQSRDHQNDPVRLRRQALMQAAGVVAELAGQGVVGDDAPADLVGDQP